MLTNRTILITGASSGIGRKVATQLSKHNNRLILTARRQDRLNQLADEIRANGSEALVCATDALDELSAQQCIDQIVAKFGVLDVALLNVGDGPAFNMATATAAEVKDNMQVNYDSMVNYLVPIIQVMKHQKQGTIAHTNSLASFLGLPMQGPYSAAKAAGRILLDSCRLELKRYNINVVSLYPGFVATERIKDDGIPHPFQISEDRAAREIIMAIDKQKPDHLFPTSLKALITLSTYLPKPVVSSILRRTVPEEY